MAFLTPDRYFARLSRVHIQHDLIDKGFQYVMLDIDNTILTRDTHDVPRDVSRWIHQAQEAGITFCLVSNNWHESVYDLAKELELPLVAKAIKPLPFAFLKARSKVGASKESTVVIGDQLITDIFGGHFLGMAAYLLAPLVEQDLPHTLMLRNLERFIMGDRQPEGTVASEAVCSHTPCKEQG